MKPLIFSLVLCCSFSLTAFAQERTSIFDVLQSDTIRHIFLETNYTTLIKKKKKEVYQPAQIAYVEDGDTVSWSVKLRTRGNMRKRICYFPPFKIKFKKAKLNAAGLESEWNDLKVVSGCRSGKTYDQYILKEYLAYQLFNVLTDKSFEVQLVKLHIKDEAKEKQYESYGFLIEPEEELAARLGGRVYNPEVLNPKYTLAEQHDLMSVFQYMIGNTDWSVANGHNVKAIRSEEYKLPFCVPYDFDYAGIVNTNYAVPHESLAIEKVTERLFRGLCRGEKHYEKMVQPFIENKSVLYQVVDDCPYLIEKEVNSVKGYLDDFFAIIESEKGVKKQMLVNCN